MGLKGLVYENMTKNKDDNPDQKQQVIGISKIKLMLKKSENKL
jgi:hypothetical protein